MGKGDKKSKKGKRWRKSFGNVRKKVKHTQKATVKGKPATAPKAKKTKK